MYSEVLERFLLQTSKTSYLHTSATVNGPLAGVVRLLLGSLSHVTVPLVVFLMYLYWSVVDTGRSTVTTQFGYVDSVIGMAFCVFQSLRTSMDPRMKALSGYD